MSYYGKRSKYNARKTTIDGIIFDSSHEASRYCELKLLQRAGKISDLRLQVEYELIPAQYKTVVEYTPKTHKPKNVQKLIERKLSYIADFVYNQDGKMVVEDAKGYKNGTAYDVFVIKRKLMLYIHGIQIVEV